MRFALGVGSALAQEKGGVESRAGTAERIPGVLERASYVPWRLAKAGV